MEMIRGLQHAAFAMDDGSRVGEARRHATDLALRAGLDEVHAGRVALVVTELGNNLVRHAEGGALLIGVDAERSEVEVISTDRGPGMQDVARSLRDGFSTGGTPGTGLGAVQRLSTDFHIHSSAGEGTVIVSRVRSPATAGAEPAPPAVVVAGICVALPGEIACGDAWAVAFDGGRCRVMVADGLGHGPDAAEASRAALDVFTAEAWRALPSLMSAVHAGLRSTRGAAVSVLELDGEAGVVRSCGAGNVTARLLSGGSDKTLLSQHGTAGVQMRTPEEARTDWPDHAILVVHSDGIETRWSPQRLMPVLARDPALAAAILWRDHNRGRDDSTVVVLRRAD
jgi:anti-sigma regulatory factor (Ser/Thr protein kinase)